MISQFYVLSLRGDTIIFRDYLGNVQKVQLAGAQHTAQLAAGRSPVFGVTLAVYAGKL